MPSEYDGVIELAVETIPGIRRSPVGRIQASFSIQHGEFAIVFKDPHVIRLPPSMGGLWLMVLVRYRIPASLLKKSSGGTLSPGQFATAEKSSGDIVGFVARDVGFTIGLRGPFLLVDSIEALCKDQAFRLWLGVPSATVATNPSTGIESLFVHYVVEAHFDDPLSGASVLDASFTYAQRAWWCEAQDEAVGGSFSLHGRGIAGKRFSAKTVSQPMAGDSRLVVFAHDEARWTHETALEGDLLGLIEVLVPPPGLPATPTRCGGSRASSMPAVGPP